MSRNLIKSIGVQDIKEEELHILNKEIIKIKKENKTLNKKLNNLKEENE